MVEKTTVVAHSISHPNGVRVRNGRVYVTVSRSPRSSARRPAHQRRLSLRLDDETCTLANTLDDKNLLVRFVTRNRDCQYGADGMAFDSHGNLFIGNFGDGHCTR